MATVIRAGEAMAIQARPTAINLNDHLDEARRTVERARREGERIVGEARAQADQVHKETRESGYEEGFRLGKQEGEEAGYAEAHARATAEFEREHADLVSDLHRVVDEVDAIKTDLRLAVNKDLLGFAVRLATKLTFEIGALHTESATANLERAAGLIGSRADLAVRAHPRDLAALRTFAGGVVDRVTGSSTVRFVEDESVAPGGCVVSSEATEVDASLQTQTEELVALLLGSSKET